MKILMVCLGNICRSPLAEGILQKKVKEKGLNWLVDSAGTGGWHSGQAPDSRSVAVAKKYGIDIGMQRARKVRSCDFEEYDLLFAMDLSNYKDLYRLTISDLERAKINLIMEEVYPNEKRSVPDPYYDDDGFEKVYAMLDKACDNIIANYC